jgi:hypothetical protein
MTIPVPDVTRWFESSDEEASEAPISEIFHYCLDAMEASDFDCMALMMSDMMPYLGKYDIAVMLAPLSITVPCSTRVPGRSAYYLAVREELGRRGRVDVGPLLQGLE